MRNFFKNLVRFYKLFFSPLLGASCRFHPTCSTYALEALDRFPISAALTKIIRRILSCHPLHPGGFDPVVPKEFQS